MRIFKRRPTPHLADPLPSLAAPRLTPVETVAERQLREEVEAEIAIGILRVTGLPTRYSEAPGWVELRCRRGATAAELARRISVRQVPVRVVGRDVFIPALPSYEADGKVPLIIEAVAEAYAEMRAGTHDARPIRLFPRARLHPKALRRQAS